MQHNSIGADDGVIPNVHFSEDYGADADHHPSSEHGVGVVRIGAISVSLAKRYPVKKGAIAADDGTATHHDALGVAHHEARTNAAAGDKFRPGEPQVEQRNDPCKAGMAGYL